MVMMNGKNHFFAIAYDWLLVPTEVVDFDLALIVSSCAGLTMGTEKVRIQNPDLSIYHAKLPENETRHELSDVSGCLGLLHPVSDEYAERKAVAFERLVSDAILWRLAKEPFHQSEKTTILLQGPMLPKLRGRLMYRSIPEHITLCALTDQPDWFRRIEAAEQSYKALRESNISGFGAAYPPRALDRGTRSWVHRSPGGFPLHFEVVTNMLDCFCPTRKWLDEIVRDIEQLVSPSLLENASQATNNIPIPLLCASRQAKDAKNRENTFITHLLSLRGVNYNLKQFELITASTDVLQSLRSARLKLETGDELCLEDCVGPEKEEQFYSLFKEAWRLMKHGTTEPSSKGQELILSLETEERPRFTDKDVRNFATELWKSIDGLVEANGRSRVQSYLRKVSLVTFQNGTRRVEQIRQIFVDRQISRSQEDHILYNRFSAKLVIDRIMKATGIPE
jgi:hypothetical protein